MGKLRALDLFSGIGGFSLGLERTGGFETVAFCEIDPFCRRVLAKHWPKVRQYEDVRTLTADTLRRDGIAVDVITGGFPCQDVSSAGHQAGIDGERSGLWGEIIRLVGGLRPDFLIVENVSNLLAGERGAWFGRVLGDLAAIGYDAEWHCIPAAYVGLPHSRDRVWVVAYPQRVGRLCLDKNIQDNRASVYLESPSEGWADTIQLLPTVGELYSKPSSDFGRNDDGLSEGLDRLRAAGNAVVPQIPEIIGRAILASLEVREAA
jgi:DNA (cytosine-5)-methyltransferase 1